MHARVSDVWELERLGGGGGGGGGGGKLERLGGKLEHLGVTFLPPPPPHWIEPCKVVGIYYNTLKSEHNNKHSRWQLIIGETRGR